MKERTGMENIVNAENRAQEAARQTPWLAGLGALLSGALLLAAFLVTNEEVSQHIVFSISPLALLPAIPALYRLFRWDAPELSRLALVTGMLGMAPILLDLLATGVFRLAGAAQLSAGWLAGLQTLLVGFTILVGLWMTIIGHLGGTTRLIPPGLAVAGLVAGITRVLITGNLVLGSFSTFPRVAVTGLWNLTLLLWIASHLIFTVWLGFWLLSGRFRSERL